MFTRFLTTLVLLTSFVLLPTATVSAAPCLFGLANCGGGLSFGSDGLQSDLLVNVEGSAGGENVTIEEDIIPVISRYVIGFLGLITVTVFLVIAFRLFTADGNEEEFKSAWKAVTYAAVGLALIPISYAVVRIILGVSL